jgi:hypothetical protein
MSMRLFASDRRRRSTPAQVVFPADGGEAGLGMDFDRPHGYPPWPTAWPAPPVAGACASARAPGNCPPHRRVLIIEAIYPPP